MLTAAGPGRPLALVASSLAVLSAFLPWAADGRVGIDVRAAADAPLDLGPVSLGLIAIVVAAVPAVAAVGSDRAWPRLVAATAGASLVLTWLALGPDGALAPGVVAAMAAAVGWLYAAALARGGRR